MGLIKAAAGAAGGVLADQWKEFFLCEALPANVLAVKGQKKTTRRSSNTHGDENIITTGSRIAVADGQCMLIVEQGKVVEVCAEPGEYTYDASTEPSIFAGNLGESIGEVFRNIGKRFTFGGEAPKDQRIYYFNTKELTGNKYGTPSPVPFRIVASGRLTNEKNHVALIRAIARCRHAQDIELVIAGTGPLKKRLQRMAGRLLSRPASIGFHRNADMPALLRSGDLLVHPSIADLESVSVIEGMAAGLVPVIASSSLSAAGQFALLDESLFPVDDVDALARRIDWWIDHPAQLAKWGGTYAKHTKTNYSVESSVRKFVAMEREAIADNRR